MAWLPKSGIQRLSWHVLNSPRLVDCSGPRLVTCQVPVLIADCPGQQPLEAMQAVPWWWPDLPTTGDLRFPDDELPRSATGDLRCRSDSGLRAPGSQMETCYVLMADCPGPRLGTCHVMHCDELAKRHTLKAHPSGPHV